MSNTLCLRGPQARMIGCDVKTCGYHIFVESTDYWEALELAEDQGWGVVQYARGAWVYCPEHAPEYAGAVPLTPRGRPLIG
jgi:hypothetical protein